MALAIQLTSASAGPSSYVCQILGFQVAPGPNSDDLQWVGDLAMKTSVAIDRNTGRVIHPSIGNTSFQQVILLNRGSAGWSFKSIADSGNGGNVRYYEVQEFAEGPNKPFVAIADGIAYWGTCS